MEINKIIFYHPSKITGGAEYLFVRCAEYLVNNQDRYMIYCVDYQDGFIRRNIKSANIKFIDYDENVPTVIPDNSAVILQLNLINKLKNRFDINIDKSLLLFWCLHTWNIKYQICQQGYYYISKKSRSKLGDEVRYLTEHNVIKFMGYPGYLKVVKDLYQKPQVFEYVPNIAPINEKVEKPTFGRISKDELLFCWLGRLDKEKARNILTYMNELEVLSKKMKLSMSIIGLGPMEDYLRERAKEYTFPIHFVGEKRDADLDDFIRNHTEIGLASGTSAFEFSLRGKPVIMEWVLEHEYPAGVRDSYVLTYEDIKYDIESGFELKRIGQSTFARKTDEILSSYEDVARKCYESVLLKAPSNCAGKLIEAVEQNAKNNVGDIWHHINKASALINKGYRRILFLSKIKHMFSVH